jgi:hypothetical protein
MEAAVKVTKWNGKPITRAGWYSGIPIELYHSAGICDGPAVSSSNLRTCWSKSPAHMYAEWCENPDYEPRKSTNAMKLGAVAHHLLLGEKDFKTKYISQPLVYRDKVTAEEKKWNNNAGVCKAWNEKHQKLGFTVCTEDDLDAIVAMAKSLSLEPLINDGLLKGEVECSGFVKDKETGLWIKVRPDVIPNMTGDFVDLKTASDVTTRALQSSMYSLGYHQQGALIAEAVEQLGSDHPFAGFVLMFVETVKPFCARTVPLTDQDLTDGRKQNRVMLRQIATCLLEKHWPGPGEGDLTPMPLGTAARAYIAERLKFEGMS